MKSFAKTYVARRIKKFKKLHKILRRLRINLDDIDIL
jgi:hypothetical protein